MPKKIKTKTMHCNWGDMREKLVSPKVKFEVEHGRLVFNSMEEAMDYFHESEKVIDDVVSDMTKFDRWFEECNIKIKE